MKNKIIDSNLLLEKIRVYIGNSSLNIKLKRAFSTLFLALVFP